MPAPPGWNNPKKRARWREQWMASTGSYAAPGEPFGISYGELMKYMPRRGRKMSKYWDPVPFIPTYVRIGNEPPNYDDYEDAQAAQIRKWVEERKKRGSQGPNYPEGGPRVAPPISGPGQPSQASRNHAAPGSRNPDTQLQRGSQEQRSGYRESDRRHGQSLPRTEQPRNAFQQNAQPSVSGPAQNQAASGQGHGSQATGDRVQSFQVAPTDISSIQSFSRPSRRGPTFGGRQMSRYESPERSQSEMRSFQVMSSEISSSGLTHMDGPTFGGRRASRYHSSQH